MRPFVFCALLVFLASPAAADVHVAEVFSDHAVLQRDKELCVWGTASPNEKVHVALGKETADTQADAAGQWSVKLPPFKAQTGLTLTVRGHNELTLRDVAVGEVWLFCAYANVAGAEALSACDPAEVARADHPEVRFQNDRRWRPCDPAAAKDLSAPAYFFARDLQKRLDVPVGILYRLESGLIQAWTPAEAYAKVPELKAAYIAKAKAHFAKVREWIAQSEKELERPEPVALRPTQDQELVSTSGTYQAQIQPLTKFPLRGVVWHLGDSNVADGRFYARRLQGLIESWRSAWNDEGIAYYVIQLPPVDHEGLPDFWAGEIAAERDLKNCTLVPTCDLGYPAPAAQKPLIGRRLAQMALADTYALGEKLAAPRYQSHAINGNKIRVSFEHARDSLVSRDDKPLTHFEIAGADGKLWPAVATIDGSTVVVSSDRVAEPAHVRFAWRKDAAHNLVSRDGLPALPFRTDK